VEGCVSHWLGRLQEGNPVAAQKIWECYFERLIELARKKLRALPHREAAEDVGLSDYDSFCRGAGRGRLPQLADRENLWRVLAVITARKAAHQKRGANREKSGGRAVLSSTTTSKINIGAVEVVLR
jgi:ECF sigma factor